MIDHVLAELALAAGTFIAGGLWWQLRKRAKFLRHVLSNQSFLDFFITREILVNPPAQIWPYTQKNPIGYFVNIDVVVKADRSSQRVTKIISLVCLLLIFGFSLYLGYAYMAINFGLFCLVGFMPMTQPAKGNAVEQIVTLAVILYRWRTENSAECDNWVAQGRSLQKLYGSVQKAG